MTWHPPCMAPSAFGQGGWRELWQKNDRQMSREVGNALVQRQGDQEQNRQCESINARVACASPGAKKGEYRVGDKMLAKGAASTIYS